jgi:hypothetical protein
LATSASWRFNPLRALLATLASWRFNPSAPSEG